MKRFNNFIVLIMFFFCFEVTAVEKISQKHKWAVPLKREGLANFYKVSEDLYRAEQPTALGIREIKKMGIKTIVNLRAFNSDKDEIGDTEIGYERIYMKTWHPEKEDIVRFLKIVTDKKRTPVLVHCQHGADRTGTMCAIYRIAVEGWSKEDAIEEMTKGDFGFHGIWKNLVKFIRDLDIEDVKKKAMIKQN